MGVADTQRCHGDTSWAQYVAAVMSSFVKKVLQDDQVFAILGGEALAPREHSPLLCSPLQETVSLKGEIAQSTLFHFMLRHHSKNVFRIRVVKAINQSEFGAKT